MGIAVVEIAAVQMPVNDLREIEMDESVGLFRSFLYIHAKRE
jgi:hypothetical protein